MKKIGILIVIVAGLLFTIVGTIAAQILPSRDERVKVRLLYNSAPQEVRKADTVKSRPTWSAKSDVGVTPKDSLLSYQLEIWSFGWQDRPFGFSIPPVASAWATVTDPESFLYSDSVRVDYTTLTVKNASNFVWWDSTKTKKQFVTPVVIKREADPEYDSLRSAELEGIVYVEVFVTSDLKKRWSR